MTGHYPRQPGKKSIVDFAEGRPPAEDQQVKLLRKLLHHPIGAEWHADEEPFFDWTSGAPAPWFEMSLYKEENPPLEGAERFAAEVLGVLNRWRPGGKHEVFTWRHLGLKTMDYETVNAITGIRLAYAKQRGTVAVKEMTASIPVPIMLGALEAKRFYGEWRAALLEERRKSFGLEKLDIGCALALLESGSRAAAWREFAAIFLANEVSLSIAKEQYQARQRQEQEWTAAVERAYLAETDTRGLPAREEMWLDREDKKRGNDLLSYLEVKAPATYGLFATPEDALRELRASYRAPRRVHAATGRLNPGDPEEEGAKWPRRK